MYYTYTYELLNMNANTYNYRNILQFNKKPYTFFWINTIICYSLYTYLLISDSEVI